MKQSTKGEAMNKTFTFFHGDLDFFKVDKLPKGAKKVGTLERHVAQNGTASGHQHLVTSNEPFEVYGYGENGLAYVFEHPAAISHEEHRTHDIEPGIYVVEHEQEENPRDGIVREVVD